MYKIKRLLHIHIILIYFIYIYSHSYASLSRQAHAKEETATTDSDRPEMTKEQRELALRQFAAVAQQQLFNVKGKPSSEGTNSNSKLYVPTEMLRKYIEYREEVRQYVPDDRDFLGKINLALEGPHEDLWGALANQGQADIQVDMGPPEDHLDERKSNVDGKASHIAYITLERDPEVVSPNIEPTLPPHARSVQAQKRFVSVHMKFNLSQEVYQSPTAVDDLRGAELRLTRESIHDCEFYDCPKKPVPFFSQQPQQDKISSSNRQDSKDASLDQANLVPRYLKVYILQVNGYDQYGMPRVVISITRRVDTRQASPLIFNIKPIVKSWFLNPESNYGIIVRVTNDDKDYELASARRRRNRSSKRAANATGDADTDPLELIDVLDHIRLKRASHFASDSSGVWAEKQPSLLIYSDTTRPERYHVKRHHDADDDNMQADEPDVTTQYYQQASSYSSTSKEDVPGETPQGSLNKPSVTTASSFPNKPTSAGGGHRRPPGPRASSSGRPPGQQQGAPGKPKGQRRLPAKHSDKCGKRNLTIDFDEVGWSNWIIAPKAFQANFCAGDCNWPLADAQNSTNHAIIQAIYQSVGRLVPKSSCAPVKYGRMAILYSLDGIVQMRWYDDMIVEACGCL